METKVNLCRAKVHCLRFMRRLWELTFWVTAVQNWRLSNKYHIFVFLFYAFPRPRLDFSGGSRGGAWGASPPLIFRLKWGPKGQKNFFPLIWRSGSATDGKVQNYLWWVVIIVMEWDEQCQVERIYTTSVESQQYLQKDVLEALYGLSCFNYIFQSSFNRSVVWPLISNHFVKGVLVLCQTV